MSQPEEIVQISKYKLTQLFKAKYGSPQEALFEFVEKGDVPGIQLAVKAGAKVNEPKVNGNTALIQAAIYGKADACRVLLGFGAEVDESNSDGMTALMYTAMYNRVDTCRVLLNAGAKVDMFNNEIYTALELARQYASWGVIAMPKDPVAPLTLTVSAQDTYAVFEDMAKVSRVAGGNMSPMSQAQETVQITKNELIQLLEFGCGTVQKALFKFAKMGDVSGIQLALLVGAEVDEPDSDGMTALMWAAARGRDNAFPVLLDAGAKADMANNRGWTALSVAKYCNAWSWHVVDMLEEHIARQTLTVSAQDPQAVFGDMAKVSGAGGGAVPPTAKQAPIPRRAALVM